jgi:hypothetical protein
MPFPEGYLMTPRDFDWLDEGLAWQFQMPAPAFVVFRWWGIRHARAALLVAGAYIHLIPAKPDWRKLWQREWVAYAVWRGWV